MDNGGATFSTQKVEGLVRASVHPGFTDVRYIPEHAIPGTGNTITQAVFSILGGTFLGLGLTNAIQGANDQRVVKILAENCIKDEKMCSTLVQQGEYHVLWLVLGVVFVAAFAIVTYVNERKLHQAKEPAEPPKLEAANDARPAT